MDDKHSLWIVAIVGVVAIVSLMIIVIDARSSADAAGQALAVARYSSNSGIYSTGSTPRTPAVQTGAINARTAMCSGSRSGMASTSFNCGGACGSSAMSICASLGDYTIASFRD